MSHNCSRVNLGHEKMIKENFFLVGNQTCFIDFLDQGLKNLCKTGFSKHCKQNTSFQGFFKHPKNLCDFIITIIPIVKYNFIKQKYLKKNLKVFYLGYKMSLQNKTFV